MREFRKEIAQDTAKAITAATTKYSNKADSDIAEIKRNVASRKKDLKKIDHKLEVTDVVNWIRDA